LSNKKIIYFFVFQFMSLLVIMWVRRVSMVIINTMLESTDYKKRKRVSFFHHFHQFYTYIWCVFSM